VILPPETIVGELIEFLCDHFHLKGNFYHLYIVQGSTGMFMDNGKACLNTSTERVILS